MLYVGRSVVPCTFIQSLEKRNKRDKEGNGIKKKDSIEKKKR
jgi:hypothetical protein